MCIADLGANALPPVSLRDVEVLHVYGLPLPGVHEEVHAEPDHLVHTSNDAHQLKGQ